MLNAQQLKIPGLPVMNLTLQAGEITCLSGPSGIGKTRLLRALANLDAQTGAVLTLHGKTSDTFTGPQWRQQVMLLPADPQWWHQLVRDHFITPDQWAGQLNLPAAAMDWEVTRLSSGERQRLALLRALDRNPSVLLLDEPTAQLDPDNITAVESLIRSWCTAGRCVLWVTHDAVQVARMADVRMQLSNKGLEPAS